jgi:hypothetical protein
VGECARDGVVLVLLVSDEVMYRLASIVGMDVVLRWMVRCRARAMPTDLKAGRDDEGATVAAAPVLLGLESRVVALWLRCWQVPFSSSRGW